MQIATCTNRAECKFAARPGQRACLLPTSEPCAFQEHVDALPAPEEAPRKALEKIFKLLGPAGAPSCSSHYPPRRVLQNMIFEAWRIADEILHPENYEDL